MADDTERRVAEALADLRNIRHRVTSHSRGAYRNELERIGWRYEGGGNWSVALSKAGLVIKVNIKGDDGSDAYAAWCMFNRDLPGVPDVYHVERLGSGRSFAVIMKQYFRISSERLHDVRKECERVLWGSMEPETKYGRTAKRIRNYFVGASWDLHGSNAMQDADGSLIITDPIYNFYETTEQVSSRLSSARMVSFEVKAGREYRRDYRQHDDLRSALLRGLSMHDPRAMEVFDQMRGRRDFMGGELMVDHQRNELRLIERRDRLSGPPIFQRPDLWQLAHAPVETMVIVPAPIKAPKPHMAFIQAEEARKQRGKHRKEKHA